MKLSDLVSFMRAWASSPGSVGAVIPSGPALAELMASEITAASSPVLELGPGTGVFTRALLSHGVKEEDLTLVESSPGFVPALHANFPKARVLQLDAAHLGAMMAADRVPFGAAVSGLPLLNMPQSQVVAILSGVFAHLRLEGALYQFTYGPTCPVAQSSLDGLGLAATCVGRALLNLPPAAVYRINRLQPARDTA